MQQATGVAVVATRLAITDRRALSQAWYSALHLAERGSPGRPPTGRGRGVPPPSGTRRIGGSATAPSHAFSARPHLRPLRERPHIARAFAPPPLERRTPRTQLESRLERALAHRIARGVPSSFVVAAAGGRVQLLVRSDGARTRVVAVCAAGVRERVERALAHARFALAANRIPAEIA